jgi:hypothetical protein
MYAINVFLTFSLTTLGMLKRAIACRRQEPDWMREALVELAGAAAEGGIAVLLGEPGRVGDVGEENDGRALDDGALAARGSAGQPEERGDATRTPTDTPLDLCRASLRPEIPFP